MNRWGKRSGSWPALVVAAALAVAWPSPAPAAVAVDPRSLATSRPILELDGAMIGFLKSAEGGNAFSDVVTEPAGPNLVAKKHLAGVKYEDISLNVGTGMGPSLYQWIKDTLARKPPRKNGAVVTTNAQMSETGRTAFYNALITEVTLPALDAGSKDAAYITVNITPEYTRPMPSPGAKTSAPPSPKTEKIWLPANFRLRIDGLDAAAARAIRIEAIGFRQKPATSSVGESRDYAREPGRLEISNIVVTMPASYAKPFQDWYVDFVIKGNNGDNREKNGTIEYMSPTLKETYFTLTLKHLGIFKLSPVKAEAGALPRVRAEMYCEDMSFDFQPAAVGK